MIAEELALELLQRGENIRFTARGHSMKPFVRDGDRIEVSPRARPRVGDLVLLRQGDFGVVHRLVARLGARLLIKGDNLPRADGWFAPADVLGVVVSVEREGRWIPARRLIALAWSTATLGKRTRLFRVARRLRRRP